MGSSSSFLLQRHPGGNAKASHGEAVESKFRPLWYIIFRPSLEGTHTFASLIS
jgi:hypothetical protein